MSLVVAIKENNEVYIGADSQVSRGDTKLTINNPNNFKVWKVKNVDNCLMAHTGNVRDANVIRLMDNLVNDYLIMTNNINFEFVVKSLVPDIIFELKKYGYVKDEQYFNSMDSRFIFAYKDSLFSIGFDGSVVEVDDFVAIGSGENEAIGSLLTTIGEEPKSRIIKAINASTKSNIYVNYPIVLSNTKTTEYEIVQKKDADDLIK